VAFHSAALVRVRLGDTVAAVAGWCILRMLTSNVADLPEDFLDEREALQRATERSLGFGSRGR